ncbi:unnamed protein product [Adineta steineri]|uniref:Uncharacterized protein n=1 Tax=Adineta steineri TaxID=433720 RepID=A0A814X0Q8_9BILA|nr:unnamed protein product [Adineta steineri]CAF1209715.1 unnamed protein product [Adineta steineri]CAF3552655.1 unnamed protein product [Adineta steineri]CAF3665427.1 unnamed protein product [Adineta steineri]
MIDACFLQESTCSTDSSQARPLINQTDAFLSNDEITRDICHPVTLFPLNNDRLHIINGTNHEGRIVLQNIVLAGMKLSDNIKSSLLPYEPSSTDLLLPISDQISQEESLLQLPKSLQFVHDVHPYQKTQHDMDNLDEYAKKYLAPYVMRLQGLRTSADKGKSILPKIKVADRYISIMKQKEYALDLMIAIVHEDKVNNKRYFYACEDIQFLPADTDIYADAVNPIQFNLNSIAIESDGIIQLSLRLINQSSQPMSEQFKSKLFHELDENIAMNLHPTPYDPRFFRLWGVLIKDYHIIWDTLCLSDYVRPSKIIHA